MSQRILTRNTVPIIIIGMMFFVFGFATWINAMLIPYFKIACELTHFQSYLVTFAFYISYLVVSVPSSFLLKKIDYFSLPFFILVEYRRQIQAFLKIVFIFVDSIWISGYR